MLAESSTAHISGDFVVFIIGVTVHNWLDVKAWWPVFTGMKRMMDELKVCNATSQLSFAESCMPGGRYIDRWRRAKGDLPDTIVHETEANAFGGVQAHPECGYLGGHSYVSNPLVSVQYWRSMDSLTDYARSASHHGLVSSCFRQGTL